MERLETIFTRRSIRKFKQGFISDKDLKLILKAGFAAPSAHNRMPWEFIVLKDSKVLESIAENHKYAKMLPKTGRGIVVCGDKEKQNALGFLVADCSAAIENMLLAANALGLGAVWCGIYPKKDLVDIIQKTLNLPNNIIPIGLVVLGIKNEEKAAKNIYDENKIHLNKW